MKKILTLCFFCISLASFAEAPAPAQVSPIPDKISAEAKALLEEVTVLFDASRKVNAGGETQAKARGTIDKAMDWERIAKDCLGAKKWAEVSKKSPGQLNEYKSLLKEVIVKTAYSRMDTFWDGVTYKFDPPKMEGKKAQVTSRFLIKGEEFTLDYYLEKGSSAWKVYDIAYEGLRYSVNINEQLVAFLKEKNFGNLLEKLKKRREELEKPAVKKG